MPSESDFLTGELPEPKRQEERIYEGYKNAYPFADVAVAQRECSVKEHAEAVDCPECAERVVIHCDQCKVQVTGCTCTDTVLHGREYALKARAVRPSHGSGMNRAQRRQKEREKRRGGLWTPNQIHR